MSLSTISTSGSFSPLSSLVTAGYFGPSASPFAPPLWLQYRYDGMVESVAPEESGTITASAPLTSGMAASTMTNAPGIITIQE